MPHKRTVLVESISYRGTDDQDHVGVRGEEITVADDGVAHFDWVHDATPEAQQAKRDKAAAEAERSARLVKPKPEAKPA